jgi:hypothetical protein
MMESMLLMRGSSFLFPEGHDVLALEMVTLWMVDHDMSFHI